MKSIYLKSAYLFIFPAFFFLLLFFVYHIIIPPRTPQILKIFTRPVHSLMAGEEIRHYSMDIRPTLKEGEIKVATEIVVDVPKGKKRFFFLLNPGLKIKRAEYAGMDVTVRGIWILRWFVIPQVIDGVNGTTLTLDYSGRLKRLNLGYGHISEVGFMLRSEELWYPTNLRSFFTADIRERIPANMTPILLGKAIRSQISDSERIVDMRLDSPTTRFSLAAGDYSESVKEVGDVEYRIYVSPSCLQCKSENILNTVSKSNDIYQELYGSNGLSTMSLLIDPREARSFNHGAGFMTVDDGADRLTIAHEVSHNWWAEVVSYDWLSKDGNGGLWLMEGFAEYSSFVVAERIMGREDYLHIMEGATFNNRLGRSVYSITAFDNIGSLGQVKQIHQLLYTKGARILVMLREMMGEEQFYGAVRELLDRYRHRTVSALAFEGIVEERVGDSIGSFFDNWLRGTGELDLAIRILGSQYVEGEGFLNRIKVINEGEINPDIPVKLQIETERGLENFLINLKDGEGIVEIKNDSAVKSITIDPDFIWADMNRENNRVELSLD